MRKFVFLILCFSIAPGCFHHNEEPVDHSDDLRKYNENLQKWQDANITDYQFTYEESCFCQPREALVIEVQNSAVVSAFYAQSGEYLAADQLDTVPTIDDLFSTIKDALNRNAYKIQSTYDSDYGFPQHVYIDYLKNAVDEEFAFTVSDFQ